MEKYYIKETCEKLNINTYELRYLEKALNIKPKRDNLKNRYYTDNDINYLKAIINLKNQGLNYKAIKTVLKAKEKFNNKNTEKNKESNNNINKEITLENDSGKNFSIVMKSIIENSLTTTLSPKFKNIENKIDNLSDNIKDENEKLKQEIETKQNEHFKELDKKLSLWREKSKVKQSQNNQQKKPWYKKIFT